MASAVVRHFGTFRGAVRLALAYVETALRIGSVKQPADGTVRRLVFVCHGNICRSAYAEALAHRHGVAAVSFGLSTQTGNPAHPPIVDAAIVRGVSLESHRATTIADYEPREGDYLLAMETRHLRKLAANTRLAHLPRGLLGSYAARPVPHLHDPYGLDEAYLPVCLDRIEAAVAGLCARFNVGACA